MGNSILIIYYLKGLIIIKVVKIISMCRNINIEIAYMMNENTV
jgi:hypothetical protein